MKVTLLTLSSLIAIPLLTGSLSKAGEKEAQEACKALRQASAMGMNSGAIMAGALFLNEGPKGKKVTWVDEYGFTHSKYGKPTPKQVQDHNYTMNRILEICPAYAQGFRF